MKQRPYSLVLPAAWKKEKDETGALNKANVNHKNLSITLVF